MAGLRRATTGDDGRYQIRGISDTKTLVIAADHPKQGRSPAAGVDPTGADPSVDLTLGPTGGVRGKVTIDNAQVIKADIVASNGVIHVINEVLLPKEK